jgi:type IV secretion system protein VirD4
MFSNLLSRQASPDSTGGLRPQLLLGWSGSIPPDSFGFGPPSASPDDDGQAVLYGGDAPLLTCAPTGAGKGRGVLIPNLMTYPGQVIVMDIKGELFQVTSRRRREMGKVYLLDPFHLVSARSDSLNALDLLTLPRSDPDSDAEMLASLLSVGHQFEREPYWNITANGLTSGLIAHIATSYPAKERHLGHLRGWLYHNNLEMAIATMLDKNELKSRMARDQFVAYLTAPHEQTRPCIRTTACSYISALGSNQVLETLRSSSFRLQDVYDGRPLSIYIVIPPEKLESHKSLLRLWCGTLLTTVMRRTTMPRLRTLFLLDECAASLGNLPILRQAITLLRGSGLQTWTFFQDLSQLRQLYPDDWQTIVNNSGVLQVFGITNHNMAKEWSELLGLCAEQLAQLAREDTVVMRQGQGSLVCRRPDYLKDEVFAGMFDANQRFTLQGQPVRGQR